MGRFFLGFFTPIILVFLIILGLWICDLTGILKIDDLVLNWVSGLPGLHNLKEDYELGKKRSEVLQEKEKALRTWESKVKASKAKLDEQISMFEAEKMKWEKENVPKELGKTGSISSSVPTASGDEADQKKYLALIGGMKPEKAAAVIQQLPESTVHLLLKQLRPAQATKILEKLPAEYVVRLTEKKLNFEKNQPVRTAK